MNLLLHAFQKATCYFLQKFQFLIKVEKPMKLTTPDRFKLSIIGRFKLTTADRCKLTTC